MSGGSLSTVPRLASAAHVAPGECLVFAGYRQSESDFVPIMADATRRLVSQLRAKQRVTMVWLSGVLTELAEARRRSAELAGTADARVYGRPVEFWEDVTSNPDWRIRDVLRPDSGRHTQFFERAREQQRLGRGLARAGGVTRQVGEETLTLSRLGFEHMTYPNGSEDDFLAIVHPPFDEIQRIKTAGLALVMELLATPSGDPYAELDTLALAYELLVHGTPFIRGTPAILESFVDALLRARHGLCLPGGKVAEPFWDVMLRDDQTQPYSAASWLACYGNVSPPPRNTGTSDRLSAAGRLAT